MTVAFADIEAAAERLGGRATRTPLLESAVLNATVGGRVLLKPECLQRTGSFKFRGAWNAISQLDPARNAGGVVAYSSGNHAQGVAAAARIVGLPALIIMPSDTPRIKQENTRSYGAEVVLYDRATEDREAIAAYHVAHRSAVFIPPFDHPDVIAGQGTVGLELAGQAVAAGCALDHVLVCCGGGGLVAGIAIAMARLSPSTLVHSVEPDGFDDYARSLRSGRRERNAAQAGSICDALLTPQPGVLTFEINRHLLGEGLVVDNRNVADAMRFAFEVLKLVIEPGGAVALAAVLSGKLPTRGRNIGVIISGGNADASLFARVLRGEI
ncbi:MAG: threonine/serine dehydratase [Alphaproteobacteria bacterium]|nr:threonine/serine dehydratase [Alphaproteobacteria bacterium]